MVEKLSGLFRKKAIRLQGDMALSFYQSEV